MLRPFLKPNWFEVKDIFLVRYLRRNSFISVSNILENTDKLDIGLRPSPDDRANPSNMPDIARGYERK